jgi:hypothetical protein
MAKQSGSILNFIDDDGLGMLFEKALRIGIGFFGEARQIQTHITVVRKELL